MKSKAVRERKEKEVTGFREDYPASWERLPHSLRYDLADRLEEYNETEVTQVGIDLNELTGEEK